MATAFSGAWLLRNQAAQTAPLVPPLDPQHSQPDPNPQFQATQPDWIQAAQAPGLPAGILPQEATALHTGIGPVDAVDYDHPLNGVGWGHGLGVLEAQDIRGAAGLVDDNSVAARMYQPAVDRQDGEWHVTDVRADMQQDGDSPETLVYHRRGVGTPIDPFARASYLIRRTFERFIDMHMWNVEFRPLVPRNSPPQVATGVTNPDHTVPGTMSSIAYLPVPPDRFLSPFQRRTPADWQEPWVSDGTPAAMVHAQDAFSLPAWGL